MNKENLLVEFNSRLKKLYEIRYPAMIIASKNTDVLHVLVDNLSDIKNADIVNFLKDILSKNKSLILGSYDRVDLLIWLLNESRKNRLLVVYNLEPLFATWSINELKIFVKEFLKSENHNDSNINIPIILIIKMFNELSIEPKDEGQGIIWFL